VKPLPLRTTLTLIFAAVLSVILTAVGWAYHATLKNQLDNSVSADLEDKARALHAILAAFICKGDNGKTQPNYSTWGGSLISSSISLSYYPSADRNAQHVFKNFGIGMGFHVAGGLVQEFILDKFTSRGKH